MLITRPDHDLTTRYLYHWSRLIIDYACKVRRDIVDLSRKRANRREFESVIKKTKPSLLVLNGHGDESMVKGYDDEPLVTDKNINLLKNKIVYARSCSSAKKLGVESIKAGCQAYVGYDDEFVFMVENEKISSPLQDKTASIFLDPSNKIATSLLKGHTAGESNLKAKSLYRKQIIKFMTSNATSDQKQLIPLLVWDYDHQVCLGNPNARVRG